jgi:hypothetical protein
VRFLPLKTPTGEPFLEVLYYGDELGGGKRIVAPYGFGLPDPIKDAFDTMRKTKDGWQVAKNLRAKPRYYAAMIVRGEEDKGPQVWEFSAEIRDMVYNVLSNKDYVDEDLFSPETGYDWTIKVTQAMDNGKPKLYKGNPVKAFNIQNRKKPSPLSKVKATADSWIANVPDLAENFKSYAKSPEELLVLCDQYIATLVGQPVVSSSTPSGASVAPSSVSDKLDSAFADMG